MFDQQKWRQFAKEIEVASRNLNDQQAVAAMVQTAEEEKRRVISTSLARSGGIAPDYRQIVDGREGAALNSVKPGGIIVINWNYVAEIAQDTMDALVARSPRESGDYIRGLKMFINNQEVPDARWSKPPPGTVEIKIVATVDYARRLEIGHYKGVPRKRIYFVKQVGPFIMQETMTGSRSLYGNLAQFSFGYTPLAGGYRLAAGSGSIRRRRGRTITEMEYPTIIIRSRTA